MTATVTVDGTVIIPKPVLEQLGLFPGSKVDFVLNSEGQVLLVPLEKAERSKFAHLRGHAGPGLTTDEVMAMTRGED